MFYTLYNTYVTFLPTHAKKREDADERKKLVHFMKTIDLLARQRGVTIDELGEALGIDRRSVYRQRDIVEELGFPVMELEKGADRKKRWKLTDDYVKKLPNRSIPNLNLTFTEIIALYFLRHSASVFRGTEIEDKIKSAFSKLGIFVPEKFASRLDRIRTLFIPASKFTKDYSEKGKVIDELRKAIFDRLVCKVRYHSFSDNIVKEYPIEPLHFFEKNGGLYILANIVKYKEVRTLAVERIKAIEPTGEIFDYPKDFDPKDFLSGAFDMVADDPFKLKAWFSAGQARYIKERTWSKGQKIIDAKDGSIVIEMKTSGWWDVKKWVMSFGPEARVLAPKKMREEIISDLRIMAGQYSKN